MPMYDENESMIKLSPSICPKHNLPYQTYCSHESCDSRIRLCVACKADHVDHLKFLTQKRHVIEDITRGMRRCLEKVQEYDNRSRELTQLMKVAETKASQQYELIENRLVDKMKEDKHMLELKINQMRSLAEKISQKQRVKTYFAKMQKHNLLQLRIKLSNLEGMKNLKQKNQKLRELTSKSNAEEIHQLYEDFYACKREFNQYLNNNTTFKMSQVMALRRSKKMRESKEQKKPVMKEIGTAKVQKERQKQNMIVNFRKQRPRARTTTNFGQGIINGIMNFFNF